VDCDRYVRCENDDEGTAQGVQRPLISTRVDSETLMSIGSAALPPCREGSLEGWIQLERAAARSHRSLAPKRPASPINCNIIGTGFAICGRSTCSLCPYVPPLVRLPSSRLINPRQRISLILSWSWICHNRHLGTPNPWLRQLYKNHGTTRLNLTYESLVHFDPTSTSRCYPQ
jgi:hypothetical protein